MSTTGHSGVGGKRAASAVAYLLLPLLLGLVYGVVALTSDQFELRWAVALMGLAVGGAVVLVAPNRDRMLGSLLVLSLQADVAVRLFYGRAKTGGLVFPVPVLIGVALIGHRLLRGQWGVVWRGRLLRPIVCLFAISVFSFLFTSERFAGVAHLLFELELIFLYVLAMSIVRSEEDLERVLGLLLVSLGIQCLVYFVENAIGANFTLSGEMVIREGELIRPGGTVSTNPAGFGSFIVPILMIAAARFLADYGKERRAYLMALLSVGVAAVVLTLTRATWVAAVVGLAWLVVVGSRRRLVRQHRVVFIVGAAVVGVMIFLPLVILRLQESPFDTSYEERLGLMKIALRLIAAYPITGVGPGAYPHVYKEFVTPEFYGMWLHPVHNEYLLKTAEIGLAGGVVWVVLLVSALRFALRLTRARDRGIRVAALAWSAGLAALMWEMYWDIWEGFAYNALLWFTFGLVEAAARLDRRQRQEAAGQREPPGGGAPGEPVTERRRRRVA